MFNSLSGTITGKFPQKLFLDTNGIEWDIIVPDTTLDDLPRLGEKARVFTWMQHTDSAMNLFGFASAKDRDLFFDLNKVEGVGPKSAIKIMSNIQRDQLISSLESGDLAALEKIPGLGKKTAQKMLLALKGKLTLEEDLPGVKVVVNRSGEFSDVVSALANMGYDKRMVEECISKLVEDLNRELPPAGEVAFKDKTRDAKEEILFRKAIVALAQ
ncbi:Holliday junction branch migration protein RuvA [Treponema sp.]|jgi:Holliday junction DNA helicase RuvA|uniref:Holliday junction branch migration protein RuvA n=1 Tax=Treponema sp. TaxID=166 RepID=UPI0025E4FCB7|nr:Holliday junction branch migration protein RuvA [Treponema sp.]MBR4323378.1 Holliday junction branch migration protein RuvA [Treponema sp.]